MLMVNNTSGCLDTLRPPADQLLRALADAPVGPYPLLEAALAWSERRPAGWRNFGLGTLRTDAGPRGELTRQIRYVPLMETPIAQAANRMVRLLPTMTWAVVTPAGDRPDGLLRVEAPAASYQRTLRTLTGAWRECQRLMADPVSAARHRAVAVDLWRMAILVGGQDLGVNTIVVRVSCAKTAQLLVTAATSLGLSPALRPWVRGGGDTVMITQRHQVARLRAEIVTASTAR